MPGFHSQQLAGWGNYPVHQCHVYRPAKWRDIGEILDSAEQENYIARGLGRSYGDASLNGEGGVLLSRQLDRILDFDEATGLLECEAGVTFAEILDVFVPRGFFPPVVPGTKFVSLGGAIAADVHGKNHHQDGSLAAFIESFELLSGTGETLTCSRSENRDVFWATLGGMGLTGIIVSARLRLRRVESAYMNVDYVRAANLDEALERFIQSDEQYQYSVAWIDSLATGKALGRSVLIRGNHVPVSELPARLRDDPYRAPSRRSVSVPFFLPSFVLNRTTARAFNSLFYRRHKSAEGVVSHYEPFFFPLDSVLNWNRMYGKRGFIQYQAAFPAETSRQGLVELLEMTSRTRGQASFLSVLKAFGEGNEGPLSFPMRGHTLAMDIPNSSDLVSFVRKLNEIVMRRGGRVYLAKDACLDPETFSAMYPRVDALKATKQKVDPENRFFSSLARRLEISAP